MSFEIPIPPSGEPEWPYDLYQLLRNERVSQISYVPDAGHKVLINLSLADPEVPPSFLRETPTRPVPQPMSNTGLWSRLTRLTKYSAINLG
jgi:hypothetical protein